MGERPDIREANCICRWDGPLSRTQPYGRLTIMVMGCPQHDLNCQSMRIPNDADYTGEHISRDLNADRVSEATREEAFCDTLSPPCAAAQTLSNAKNIASAAASFSGVLGERPSGRVWRVEYDPASHMVAIAGLGIGFGLNHTDARLLYLELGGAINLRRAGE